jgi:6-phosphogluconolactonase (cycloisomerase 2 family)
MDEIKYAGSESQRSFAYVGSYTRGPLGGHGEGLSVFGVDPVSGEWQELQVLKELADPSFLALGRNGVVYAVHESTQQVSAFAIDPATGLLTHLNTEATRGTLPAALSLDPSERFVIVANYQGGTVAVLPLLEGGKLGPISQLIALEGQPGPDPKEQNQSHPHDIVFDPSGRYLIVPDKGFDRIFIFDFDSASGQLTPANPPFVTVHSGSGPRHLVFHPEGNYAYLINELGSTVSVFVYNSAGPALTHLQTLSTLPDDFEGDNTTAEIMIDPSGRYVYGSNRGHDSIVVYAIDEGSGYLSPVQWISSGGKVPRFFMLNKSGRLVYAANQDSDNITFFKVDPATGHLAPTGQVIQTGSPVCIKVVER